MSRSPEVVLTAALLLGGCSPEAGPRSGSAPAEPSATPGQSALVGQSVEQGQALYQSSCVACHGADAKGRPGLGKDMTDSAFLRETSDDDLVDFLRDGRPVSHPDNTTGVPMPPRGGNPSLSDADLRSIVLYLRGFTVPR